jgi:hypothetical protein
MGRRKKNLHYGTKLNRLSISDRSSSAARPWNDPRVVDASTAYGVPFASYKHVASHENRLESIGSLEPNERMTCVQCGKFNDDCGCTENWSENG